MKNGRSTGKIFKPDESRQSSGRTRRWPIILLSASVPLHPIHREDHRKANKQSGRNLTKGDTNVCIKRYRNREIDGSVRVTDWQGKVIHKKKRGFATKKAAQEWERDLLNKSKANMNMLFKDFIDLYFEDMSHRLKISTIMNKRFIIDKKITPVSGEKPVCEITPAVIRKWQNSLAEHRDKSGKLFSPTYLKAINNQLTAIFNYAVRFYNLRENPCHKAGSMGKADAEEMLFWTWDEFHTFIPCVKDKPRAYAAFMTLYFT